MIPSGKIANRNGGNLEQFVKGNLQYWRYLDAGRRKQTSQILEDFYGAQVPLGLGVYGKEHYADFFVKGCENHPSGLTIECKWQQAAGSVDEKFPYLVANINQSQFPTIVLIDGGGYKPGTLAWLKAQVNLAQFLVAVYSMSEFQTAVNKGLFKRKCIC